MTNAAFDTPSLYGYGDSFYAYQRHGSLASARLTVPLLAGTLQPASVLDVGCGAGAWCLAWQEQRVMDVTGIDGSHMRAEQLLFDPHGFREVDVGMPFRLGRQFDLAQCLEVAEHLHPTTSETLVDNLVAHAPVILFSAAPPGQGGENHINEQTYGYWRNLFQRRGYSLYDFLRPRLAQLEDVEPWYRYNLLLFVREDVANSIPQEIRATRLGDAMPVKDVSPLPYRLRKCLLAGLPPRVITMIAQAKHKAVLWSQARGRIERV